MKKQLLNLGKALNKAEQKLIKGGRFGLCNHSCYTGDDCCTNDNLCGKIGSGGICYPT